MTDRLLTRAPSDCGRSTRLPTDHQGAQTLSKSHFLFLIYFKNVVCPLFSLAVPGRASELHHRDFGWKRRVQGILPRLTR
jgi:hypothetical protein